MKKLFFSIIIISFLVFDFFVIYSEFNYFPLFEKEIEVSFESWKDLKNFFDEIGYTSLKNPPRVYLKSFPKDLKDAPVDVRKELFVKIMLPIIRKVNSEILAEREKIIILKKKEDLGKLRKFMKKYYAKSYDELLIKVDKIPEDLAIAQAAIESAWGTSKFAVYANNIFGEWTYEPGTGIVPDERPDGEIYEIEYFRTLEDSVRSYALNLNRLPYYKKFRLIRAGIEKGHPADGLVYYSQMREKYVEIVKTVIKHLPKL
ncbi:MULTISPECIES: glucosaminidase domain-containing protein [unclassified Thermosipho (in: thermotogales)]|uniref:glucosaminidase domain-containing protein n=1 Tax=unclassified Thermosipho (in: thermotogales) TaxID=2676525 RepID=UPI0009842A11|nr:MULTISPECIES: glucosaminidase domain-containing protein [unclassified Thermosipho (in: thermotogales)]MBT1247503.1 Bax protein [Thermosipho sp. 1244]OOC46251.1 Bax protein [Thermosipho sp. 1223]